MPPASQTTKPSQRPPRRDVDRAHLLRLQSQGKTLVTQFCMLVRTARIHDPSNEAFISSVVRLTEEFNRIVRNEGEATIEGVEESIYFNGEKLRADLTTATSFSYLLEELHRRGIGSMTVCEPLEQEELKMFVLVFAAFPGGGEDPLAVMRERLEKNYINHILLGEIKVHQEEDRAVPQDFRQRAMAGYNQSVGALKDFMNCTTTNQTVRTKKARRIVQRMVDLSREEEDTFTGLLTLRRYDQYTFTHIVNVCVLAITFGQRLGLEKKALGELGMAALFHDYGKLKVPLDVLNKPGQLDDWEWQVMRSHPVQGVKNLLDLKEFNESYARRVLVAFEHHRGVDQSGYPKRSSPKKQDLFSRIVAICDAYDAMTGKRIYQKKFLPDEALRTMLKASGTRYDPLLLKAFINAVGLFPVGTAVLLSTDEVAIVFKLNRNPRALDRPLVRLACRSDKTRIPAELVDLTELDGSTFRRNIVKSVYPEDYDLNMAHYVLG